MAISVKGECMFIIKKAVLIYLFVWLCACAKDSTDSNSSHNPPPTLSSQVKVSINGKPRVSTNKKRMPLPGTNPIEYEEVTPPHFSFVLSIENKASQTLVVTGFVLEISKNNSRKGEAPTATQEYLPSDCVYEENKNPCDLVDPNTYAVLAPGSDVHTLPIVFYVQSLPENDNSFVYHVKLELLGFFSDERDPAQAILNESERFEGNFIIFSTE